jgi:hypothetical protein
MAKFTPKVEFENDRVRVTRVTGHGRGPIPTAPRQDRVIIYLKDGHVARTENGRREEVVRKAGDVVFRAGSQHQIEHLEDAAHEAIIVELKS